MPVSGCTYWESGRWVITLNASEPMVRQRFSLMHEFKHILDHTTQGRLYGDIRSDERAAANAERVADHFAACVLMPKRWLKSEWFESGQRLSLLASRLGVSTRALSLRLWHLGLVGETPRCATPAQSIRGQHRYFRFTRRMELAA
jgi:Zn-dependent peptidase ImmA (M78 family)